MEAGGAAPMYLQVVQWANLIIQLIYPVALVVILALALVKFWQLVNRIAPESQGETESKKAKSGEK